MWALVEDNKISKVYNKPIQLTIGDIVYPSNIHNLWSEAQLKTIGIYLVIQDKSNLKDKKYYINTDQSFTFADDKVTATYGTATAKNLDTLKADHCTAINDIAYGLLQPNDWRVVKATETSGSVESDWTTYRAGVRTAANDMKTKINAVSDVDALAALYVYNDADPPVRPLGEFPTPPTS
jgi:hypothetical protein